MAGRGHPSVDYASLFGSIPTSYLVMSPVAPDYVILDANETYLANVERTLDQIVGIPVFEAFPPSPDTFNEDGIPRVRASFDRAVATRQADTMPLQKYDVPSTGGGMAERYWSLISVPILDAAGEVVLLVQRAENVTDFVRERDRAAAGSDEGEARRRRQVEDAEADLFARSQELAVAVQAKELASRRLAALADVTMQLTSAETVPDLVEIIVRAALPVLNAAGASVAVRTPASDVLTVTISTAMGDTVRDRDALMSLNGPLPTALAARGSLVLVPNVPAAAGYAGLEQAFSVTGMQACAALPLQLGNRQLGSLTFGFANPQDFPPEGVELLRAVAAQCAQVLDRLQVLQAERAAAAEVQRIAETLQRSLLTEPPASDHLLFAVRYQPAQQVAQVGGDWFDAFHTVDGTMNVVIGDVAGHDQYAAAAMAQVRNILRGVAQTLDEPPAKVLGALDGALSELELGVVATVVIAQISRPERPGGPRVMRWCNAGHPPPILIRADGTVEALERAAELLVGVQSSTQRRDHEVVLEAGDTVLLYTDGLIETRGGDIEDDLNRLLELAAGHVPAAGPQALLDLVVSNVQAFNDDVALLAVRAE